MPNVCHFEIHAEDPPRAVKFYTDLFGWKITSWSGPMEYWLIQTRDDGAPGGGGGLLRRRGPAPAEGQPVNAFVCTIDVPDVDAFFAKAVALGAQVAMPKMAVPGVGWLVYVKDTEGNIFGMLQADKAAK